jgi:putative DNA primase/helicase
MNHANYDQVLSQLQDAGLVIKGGLEIDGPLPARCHVEGEGRDTRGWYHLATLRIGAEDYIVGAYGVWRGNDNGKTAVKLDKGITLTHDQRAAQKAAQDRAAKQAKAYREACAARASRRAGGVWAKLPTDLPTGNAYLTAKQVRSHGLRQSPDGALYLPIQDVHGHIHGLQAILPPGHKRRQQLGRDKTYWPAGVAKQGRFYLLGSPLSTGIGLIAEGYATAATLHEQTGLPTAVAFDAGNLLHVAQALARHYKSCRWLVCADDDYLQKCRGCDCFTPVNNPLCDHCGQPHGQNNPGVTAAQAAAVAVGGAWAAPVFPWDRAGKKLTDYNDLATHAQGAPTLVKSQIDAKLIELGWRGAEAPARGNPPGGAGDGAARNLRARGNPPGGAGDGAARNLRARLNIMEAVDRYAGTYGFGGKILFDFQERRLVHRDDVMNLLPRNGLEEMRLAPGWRVYRDSEIGFDPTERDPAILCNMYEGWLTTPRQGRCDRLLELLRYLVGKEPRAEEVYQWILKWAAYPIQKPGAKMHSALVIHGPQGTGKSRFFEILCCIYGHYGRVLDQSAVEDKFNADWAEKKLFILGDEMLARNDMFHTKNRLKAFITAKTIRVNPKNIAAHTETNHMNIVFLSNEKQPVVLENDDRRHLVVWTPPPPDGEFFDELNAEIEAGGVEALHYYLLHLDLTGFHRHTRPPNTLAKDDLAYLSAGSEERFLQEWIEGDTPWPFGPCGKEQFYTAYSRWSRINGVRHIRESNQFHAHVNKLHGWDGKSRFYLWSNTHYTGPTKQQRMTIPPAPLLEKYGNAQPPGKTQSQWLTDCFCEFALALEGE